MTTSVFFLSDEWFIQKQKLPTLIRNQEFDIRTLFHLKLPFKLIVGIVS
jgi:hypothetical protein